jgi:transposase
VTLYFAEDSNQLRRWIDGAKHSKFGNVVRFAYGLQKDISAVRPPVDATWSNSQLEGKITGSK